MIQRATRQREAILQVLRCADSHPTADWIYEEVKKSIPNISKGTVYRNLKVLRDTGKIAELNLSGTVSRYEGRQDNHYHFRCTKCGQIFDLDEPVNKKLEEKIAGKTGFTVSSHQLEFRGICKDCQQ
ncbi:MAG: transcriptional repressor [Dehalococcoidales bacterium]|mgnify:CR=1 FL=1|nr:transcriptional repressor [Dehalococcoidales bacterium]